MNRNTIVDFRDKWGGSMFSCPMCGNMADRWDTRNGMIGHIPDTRIGWKKPPCDLKIGL